MLALDVGRSLYLDLEIVVDEVEVLPIGGSHVFEGVERDTDQELGEDSASRVRQDVGVGPGPEVSYGQLS